jgi:hypothetical protein
MVSPELLSWVTTTRDVAIIFMGFAFFVFCVIGIVFAVILGLLSRTILTKSVDIMDDNVKPMFESVKTSADNVKGTTTYVSQAAVTPIVRTYGVVAGVRRAASVLAGLADASTNGKKPDA